MSDLNPYQAPTAPIGSAVVAVKCPNCSSQVASPVGFTWWGGALGPRLFKVVKCSECKTQYNGRTGGRMTKVIILYQLIAFAILVPLAIAWVVFKNR
jgi:hypothetical protein